MHPFASREIAEALIGDRRREAGARRLATEAASRASVDRYNRRAEFGVQARQPRVASRSGKIRSRRPNVGSNRLSRY